MSSLTSRSEQASHVKIVPLKEVLEDPHNARQVFDPAKLEALAESIRAQGILQDPIVRLVKMPGGSKEVLQLVDGHRRVRAAKLAGLKQIRVTVLEDLDDRAAALAAATANLQREDLTPYEQARAFKTAIDLGMQKKELCERAGIVFNTLKARLQLLELPEPIAQRVGVGGFTAGHAQTLLPLGKHPGLLELAVKAYDQAAEKGDLPGIQAARELVWDAVTESKLVANPHRLIDYNLRDEIPDLDKKLRALPHLELPGPYGGTQLLVTDRTLLEERVQEWTAVAKAKRSREEEKAKKQQQSLKVDQKAEREKRRLEREAERHAIRLRDEGFAAKLKTSKPRALAAWAALVDWYDSDGFVSCDDGDDRAGFDFAVTLATGLGAKSEDMRATFAALFHVEDEEPAEKSRLRGQLPRLEAHAPPAWFAKLHSDAQLAILAGLMARNVVGRTYGGAHQKQLVEALTGEAPTAWEKAGATKARQLEAERAKAGKGPKKGPPPAAAPKSKKSAQELLKEAKQAKKAEQAAVDKAKAAKKGAQRLADATGMAVEGKAGPVVVQAQPRASRVKVIRKAKPTPPAPTQQAPLPTGALPEPAAAAEAAAPSATTQRLQDLARREQAKHDNESEAPGVLA